MKFKLKKVFFILFFLIYTSLYAEPLRVIIAGNAEVSLDRPEGVTLSMSYLDSVLISIRGDSRFFRGVQLDLTAPPGFLTFRNTMAVVFYNNLRGNLVTGITDIEGQQLSFEALPNRIQNTWQIPIRNAHGLRSSPYVTIPTGVILPDSFPMLFRLMPVIKGISDQLENMVFQLNVRPIFSDEGAVRFNFTYPPQLPRRPVTVLVNDQLIDPNNELVLREGEHNLVVISEDYRNQSRRFIVERGRVINLSVVLQDSTPLLVFEYPEGARIFVNNQAVLNTRIPYPIEPGFHEIRFQMSNYSIIRSITVQRGKTYRIAMSVDIEITETD